MPKKYELTGQRFGKLIVLKQVENDKNNRKQWLCKCDCGKEIIRTTTSLMQNKEKANCGCYKMVDITGQRFGKLIALEPTEERKHTSVVWKCLCDCGNICYATREGLRVGDNVSCGCKKSDKSEAVSRREELIGKEYGLLKIIGVSSNLDSRNLPLVICQCNCGNIKEISLNNLITGNTQSCGCLQGHSIGELIIKDILKQSKIEFIQEYIFSDLPNRRYDFAIFNQGKLVLLIEFDGEQHYVETPFFKTSLKEQQQIDKEKTDFANKKEIPLLRIPYWDREKISLKYIEEHSNVRIA